MCKKTDAGAIKEIKPAGDGHQVVTVVAAERKYMRKPCADCPWRVDAVGVFPAEAFLISAATAYDMSERSFGCHQSGVKHSATCAGFLLRGADHNLSVRLARMRGDIQVDVSDGGHALHDDYRAMAIANGVDPSDPVLMPCRSNSS